MKAIIYLLALAAVAFAAPALAHRHEAGDLAIGHPWSRPAAAGMNGAGYLTIANTGTADDVLLSAESPAAARVEVHESSTAGGVMRMKKLERLAVPAGSRVELAPGGVHLMLLKLNRPLAAGDKVPATLVFQRAGRVEVKLSVQAGAGHGHGH